MMSYLEGDSLLREIEKSLEKEDEGEDDEDIEAFIQGTVSDSEPEKASIIDAKVESIITTQAAGSSSQEPSATKIKRQYSNGKSSSMTRPSSAITTHTTSSKIRKRKRVNNPHKLAMQQFTSQQQIMGVSGSESSDSSPRANLHPTVNNFLTNPHPASHLKSSSTKQGGSANKRSHQKNFSKLNKQNKKSVNYLA